MVVESPFTLPNKQKKARLEYTFITPLMALSVTPKVLNF